MSPTSSSPSKTRRWPLSVTSPITECRTSQRSHTSLELGEAVGLDHAEHPLLRLRDHDLEGLHVGLAEGHARNVEVDSHAALRRHLRRARGQSRGAQVLERAQSLALEQLQAALEQLLLLERVADLDARPLGLVPLVELGAREHRRPTDAVPAGARAEQHHGVADARGGAADQPVVPRDPQAHGVHEAVLLVGRLEVDLAADRRYPDRVAVVADALHRPVEQVARPCRGELAEAQRVEDGDRPRADREDVTEDAAHTGGRALERLDGARVVVRLDLEGHGQPVADVDDAGVLARAHEHVPALGGEPSQELARVLVRAVLGPHEREHGQLERVWLPAESLADAVVLGVGQAQLAVRGGDAHPPQTTPPRALRRARRATRTGGRRRPIP